MIQVYSKHFFLQVTPGSGKSFVTSSVFAGTGLKLVNSDIAFERELKKAGLSLQKCQMKKNTLEI